jgi:AcrR family transcriptional regulator
LVTQTRATETRSRILQAAADCFTGAGYDATGVAEICERAGVSKGAFYHHFPSKQAAFLALFESWIAALDEPVAAAFASGESAPARLSQLTGLVGRVFDSAAGQIPLFLEFWRQAATQPEVWRVIVEPYRRFHDSFSRLIAQGVAEGTLKPVDPDEAGRALVALGVGLVLQGLLDPDGADWRRVAEGAVALFLTGLAK